MMFPWHQYLLALILIVAGFFHIQKPRVFRSIMPEYLPAHNFLVLISGVAEMVFGFMLLTQSSQSFAAWLIVAMFVAYLPIHISMIQNPPKWFRWPRGFLWMRLVLQFGLIYWAVQYV